TGAPRFGLTHGFGTVEVSNRLGARRCAAAAEAVAAFGPNAAGFCTLPGGACPAFDNEGALYGEHQLAVETDASVTGGNDQTTYYLSGLVKRDGGIVPHTCCK